MGSSAYFPNGPSLIYSTVQTVAMDGPTVPCSVDWHHQLNWHQNPAEDAQQDSVPEKILFATVHLP